MTVAELVNILTSMDPESEVVALSPDRTTLFEVATVSPALEYFSDEDYAEAEALVDGSEVVVELFKL